MVWLLPTAPASWVNPAPDPYTLTALNYAPQASGLYTGYFLCLEQSPFQLSLCPHGKSLLSPLVAYTEPTRLIRCHFWASTATWAPHPTLTLQPVPPSHPGPLYLCLLMPVLSILSCHCLVTGSLPSGGQGPGLSWSLCPQHHSAQAGTKQWVQWTLVEWLLNLLNDLGVWQERETTGERIFWDI